MRELAADLGVTESRISQMRAEALKMLRDGLNAQLSPEMVPVPVNSSGAVARRKAAYYAQVAAHSNFRQRLTTHLDVLDEATLFDDRSIA